MSKLMWDKTAEHFYETGVNQGVLYVYNASATDKTKAYDGAHAWNGLISVSESPTGADANALYADNSKYLNLISREDFEATIEAYTYPDAFAACDGSAELAKGVMIGQQKRGMFGLSYVTRLGNDVDGSDFSYKIHLIYGATASPSQKSYQTINDSPDAITFSWDIKTVPVEVAGAKPTATVTIDASKFTTEAAKAKLAAFEAILYGSDDAEPYLPLPAEVKTLLTVTE